ncbi:MAG: AAA family ATPase, partial [Prevotellaceae bacterium]|nr:AAA family ATPase [Prevotellaceae bacterium]
MSSNGFVISSAASHSGKSTLAAALLRAFTLRGKRVQPFKCGPDYIDTRLHRLATRGCESVNLDPFMASREHLRWLYSRYGEGADLRLVEGAMGLYDGYDRMRGSTADVARALQLPVVLVIDARAAGYGIAPLLHGFRTFSDSVEIGGVILNQVGSSRHYQLLRQACEDACVRCFGYLPRDKRLAIPDRHLGLDLDGEAQLEET